MRGKLVGLSGRKQSGKNTAAEALVRELGYVEVSFAQAIKDILYSLEGAFVEVPEGILSPEKVYLPYQEVIDRLGIDEAKELVPGVRKMMQTLGTEGGREIFGEEVWTQLLFNKISPRLNNGESFVITDVRFPNEVAAVEFAGGTTIKIIRPSLESSGDTHPSEIYIDGLECDMEVINDSSVEYLQSEIVEKVKSLD